MNFLVILIYRLFYILLKAIILLLKPILNSKMKLWIQLRNQPVPVFPNAGKIVFLFHAASGEIEYVKSLIRELKEARAEVFIVVSYSSPSAQKLFENIKIHVDLFLPLPWDQPAVMEHFLTALNPHSLFFARTDFWPELMTQAYRKKINLYVVSFNPSLSFTNRFLIKNFLNKASALFCVHPQQIPLLKNLVSENVFISAPGDTRFDQVFWRLKQPTRFAIELTSNLSYGVLGSTWEDDEKHFTPLLSEMISNGYKMIWSPHEVDARNIQRIEALLEDKKLKFQKLSAIGKEIPYRFLDCDVLLIDQIGYLADLYRNASWAFVGGSFKHKVHSVMEPLCCAIPIVVGPFINNSPEALKYSHIEMNGLPVIQIVSNSTEFLSAINKVKNAPSQDFKRLLIGHLEQHRNATRKILHYVVRRTQESLNS